ncbi:MAG: 3-isopropylmalate dehydratase [Halobacteriota archaeon]|nr:3-isopropylmalate dehydratase [Halobacteriota archaeon]
MSNIIKGEVLRIFAADTNTDEIISGKFKYDAFDFKKLAVHAFEAIDPSFYEDAQKLNNPIIVAERNFGCGSSREQAPLVIQGSDVACVIAESFARIFYRNCFNIGLPIVECKDISKNVDQNDELEIDLAEGTIKNISKGTEYRFNPLPEFMQNILDEGGLMPYLKKKGGYGE